MKILQIIFLTISCFLWGCLKASQTDSNKQQSPLERKISFLGLGNTNNDKPHVVATPRIPNQATTSFLSDENESSQGSPRKNPKQHTIALRRKSNALANSLLPHQETVSQTNINSNDDDDESFKTTILENSAVANKARLLPDNTQNNTVANTPVRLATIAHIKQMLTKRRSSRPTSQSSNSESFRNQNNFAPKSRRSTTFSMTSDSLQSGSFNRFQTNPSIEEYRFAALSSHNSSNSNHLNSSNPDEECSHVSFCNVNQSDIPSAQPEPKENLFDFQEAKAANNLQTSQAPPPSRDETIRNNENNSLATNSPLLQQLTPPTSFYNMARRENHGLSILEKEDLKPIYLIHRKSTSKPESFLQNNLPALLSHEATENKNSTSQSDQNNDDSDLQAETKSLKRDFGQSCRVDSQHLHMLEKIYSEQIKTRKTMTITCFTAMAGVAGYGLQCLFTKPEEPQTRFIDTAASVGLNIANNYLNTTAILVLGAFAWHKINNFLYGGYLTKEDHKKDIQSLKDNHITPLEKHCERVPDLEKQSEKQTICINNQSSQITRLHQELSLRMAQCEEVLNEHAQSLDQDDEAIEELCNIEHVSIDAINHNSLILQNIKENQKSIKDILSTVIQKIKNLDEQSMTRRTSSDQRAENELQELNERIENSQQPATIDDQVFSPHGNHAPAATIQRDHNLEETSENPVAIAPLPPRKEKTNCCSNWCK